MTAKEMAEIIGRRCMVTVEADWSVDMDIQDVRRSYGKVQYQVSPVNGCGVKWVDASRVRVVDPIAK